MDLKSFFKSKEGGEKMSKNEKMKKMIKATR